MVLEFANLKSVAVWNRVFLALVNEEKGIEVNGLADIKEASPTEPIELDTFFFTKNRSIIMKEIIWKKRTNRNCYRLQILGPY